MSEQACVHTGPPKGVRHSPSPLRSRAARGRRGQDGRRDWRPLWLASPVVVAVTVAAGLGLWSPRAEDAAEAQATPAEPRARSASSPARAGTREPEASRAFQQAQAALQLRRADSNAAARRLYEAAIRRDPGFARAYAGLAMTYALEQQHGWGPPGTDGGVTLQRAADLAAQATRLQPTLPEARWALAYVYSFQRRHAEALRELEETLRLDPAYADALALQGAIHLYLGDPGKTVNLARQALRLNHEATSLYLLLLGRAYYFLGDTAQARQYVGQSLQRNPQNIEARLYMAAAEHDAGRSDAAQWQVTEILQLDPDLRADDWLANYPLVDPGSRDRLRRALLAVGL
jgi:tetratricopeptide (TPR) repeat protein